MINRRMFIQSTACSALGVMTYDVFAAARKLDRIGLQLYTVRSEMAKDFEGSLKRVAEIGYKEVEFAGYYNRTPQQVKEILARYNLTTPAAHVPLAEVQSKIDSVIEGAKTMGQKYLICPYLDAKDRKSLDDYKRHAATFNKAGEACKKAGIQFGYHNHDFEFEAKDGKLPYDLLLAETDKNLVKMELDLYWITKANQSAVTYLEKYKDRFVTLHVKDLDKTPKRGITEVGNGTIDFKNIFAKAPRNAIKHYFVEQDICPGSPFDSIKTSFDYLTRLEF